LKDQKDEQLKKRLSALEVGNFSIADKDDENKTNKTALQIMYEAQCRGENVSYFILLKSYIFLEINL